MWILSNFYKTWMCTHVRWNCYICFKGAFPTMFSIQSWYITTLAISIYRKRQFYIENAFFRFWWFWVWCLATFFNILKFSSHYLIFMFRAIYFRENNIKSFYTEILKIKNEINIAFLQFWGFLRILAILGVALHVRLFIIFFQKQSNNKIYFIRNNNWALQCYRLTWSRNNYSYFKFFNLT